MKKLAYDDQIVKELLTACCIHFEKTAPIVSQWADDLYIRIQENTSLVTLKELITINLLSDDFNNWINANYATNIVYKCVESLKQDCTGMLSF